MLRYTFEKCKNKFILMKSCLACKKYETTSFNCFLYDFILDSPVIVVLSFFYKKHPATLGTHTEFFDTVFFISSFISSHRQSLERMRLFYIHAVNIKLRSYKQFIEKDRYAFDLSFDADIPVGCTGSRISSLIAWCIAFKTAVLTRNISI